MNTSFFHFNVIIKRKKATSLQTLFLKLRFQIIINLKTMPDLERHMVSQILKCLGKAVYVFQTRVTNVPVQASSSISCKTIFHLKFPKLLPADLQQTICFLDCFLAALFLKLTDHWCSTTTWNNYISIQVYYVPHIILSLFLITVVIHWWLKNILCAGTKKIYNTVYGTVTT